MIAKSDIQNNLPNADVDQTLIAVHLRMTYEQRIAANDHALQAILELRHAFRQQNRSRR